jgi:hypothetical protein
MDKSRLGVPEDHVLRCQKTDRETAIRAVDRPALFPQCFIDCLVESDYFQSLVTEELRVIAGP